MILVYDVLSFLATLKIKFKMVMQRLWCLETGWDDWMPIDLLKTYKQLKIDMNEVKELRFPRKCIIENYEELELHGFCNASERAYGACIYMRSSSKNGEVMSRLICSKSRVAPLKKITLARLELCAALMLANLLKVTCDALELKFNKVVLWSDSSIVLQ